MDWIKIVDFKNTDLVGDIGTYNWDCTGISDNYDFKIKVEEKEGDTTNESKTFLIDHTVPKTGDNIHDYWINKDYEVVLTPDDPINNDRSGLNRTYYRINNGDWIEETGNEIRFMIEGEGEHLIEFYSIDNVSNQEDIKSGTVFIDKTKPIIVEWNIPEITYESTGEKDISVNISDALSNIYGDECELEWAIREEGDLGIGDVPEWTGMTEVIYSEGKLSGKINVDWSEYGDQYLYLKCFAIDDAGNSIESMGNVELIDKESVSKKWEITLSSSVDSDNDNSYFVGKIVNIIVKEKEGRTGLDGIITIKSSSQGFNLESIAMTFDNTTKTFTYEWDTGALNPSDDYVVNITLKDINADISKSETLTITLVESFVDFNLESIKFKSGGKEISESKVGESIDIELKLSVVGEYDGSITIEFFTEKPTTNSKAFDHKEVTELLQSNIITYNWTILETQKGSKTIYAVVDRDETVTETDESNNEVNGKIEIKKGATTSLESDGFPIIFIIIPIIAAGGIGGVFLYKKMQEEYEYEDDDDEEE